LQVLAVSCPALHALPQPLVEGSYSHATRFIPSHVPPQVAGSPAHFSRAPIGTPDTAVQVPSAPGTAHASHWPPQVELQHTPSAQKPVVHSFAAAHDAPADLRGAQLFDIVQKEPAVQSESIVQVVLHDVLEASQLYAPQLFGVASQAPPPLQLLPDTFASMHVVSPHEVPVTA